MRKWESYQVANRLKFANHWLQIILILCLILSLNYLALRHFIRFDLTTGHKYALSPETKAFLQELSEPLQVIVTIPRNSPREDEQVLHRYVDELLNEYRYASRREGEFLITTEYVDIYQDLARADSLSREYGLDQVNSLLVISKNRSRLVRGSEILEFENMKPTAFTGEAALTSAIMEVSQESAPKLYFLTGHNEVRPEDPSPQRGLSRLSAELQVRNYELALLDLTTETGIPADCSILVIADPKGPLLASEVDKIRTFLLERAGRVILWSSPGQQLGLESLLSEWGIAIPDQVVVEPDPGYRDAAGTLLIRNYGDHPITESLINNQTYVISGPARPVIPNPPRPADERLHMLPLFATSSTSWAEVAYRAAGDPVFDQNTDSKGPVPIGIAAERRASSQLGIRVPGGRIIVFGGADLFSNQRIAALGNVSLFFNSLNWMLDRDRMLVIPPRPIDSYKFSLSQDQLLRIGLYFLLVPASIALMGTLIYWIRQS